MSARVFVNGAVFDGRTYLGPGAVSTLDGMVVGVGDEHAARAAVPGDAEVVDLDGGLLLPGFQDAHVHPMVGGLERNTCELTGLSSVEEYLDALRKHVAEQPGTGWVRGGGWSVTAFGGAGPTAQLLDRVVPDRPAFIVSSDHHDCWVNSKALEIAGVTADTPDPSDGWFVRDDDGNPTGAIREGAIAIVGDHLDTSQEQYDAALAEAQRYLHSMGITGWHDALVGGYAALDDPTQAYLNLSAQGRLTGRVRASLWWDRHRGVEQLDDLFALRRRLDVAGVDAGSVKVMMDGVSETFTAAVVDPYDDLHGCPCGDRGLAFFDPDEVREVVCALDSAGFAAHFHAIGDRAVRDALDAVAAARRANGMNDLKHQVAHLQLVRPEDRPRFAQLRVTANVEGMWARAGTPAVQGLLPHLDGERLGWHYPFADIARYGAELAGGSDWPVNPADPLSGVHVLVNRAGYGEDADEPLVPEQALTLDQALRAYTSGAARVNDMPHVGAIQVGAGADLVVLDRNLYDLDEGDLGSAEVRATYIAGEPVFSR